jgi:hypothetical protein
MTVVTRSIISVTVRRCSSCPRVINQVNGLCGWAKQSSIRPGQPVLQGQASWHTHLPCVRREPILKAWYRGARSRRSLRRASYIDREPFDYSYLCTFFRILLCTFYTAFIREFSRFTLLNNTLLYLYLTWEFRRGTVGSAGTYPAARARSHDREACCRAYPAHDAGVHLPAATPRPRQQPLGRARTRAAGRGEGCMSA